MDRYKRIDVPYNTYIELKNLEKKYNIPLKDLWFVVDGLIIQNDNYRWR